MAAGPAIDSHDGVTFGGSAVGRDGAFQPEASGHV